MLRPTSEHPLAALPLTRAGGIFARYDKHYISWYTSIGSMYILILLACTLAQVKRCVALVTVLGGFVSLNSFDFCFALTCFLCAWERADASCFFYRCLVVKEIQLPACQTLP